MWEDEQDKWFEEMQREEIRPSSKVVIRARQKAREEKEKREFLEKHLPIILICGLNACFAIGLGIIFMNFVVGFGQISLVMNIILSIGYLPLLVYSITILYMKNYQSKKERLKCQE